MASFFLLRDFRDFRVNRKALKGGRAVEPHYPVKGEGGLEKASVYWHAVVYANTDRADGRVETILPE